MVNFWFSLLHKNSTHPTSLLNQLSEDRVVCLVMGDMPASKQVRGRGGREFFYVCNQVHAINIVFQKWKPSVMAYGITAYVKYVGINSYWLL